MVYFLISFAISVIAIPVFGKFAVKYKLTTKEEKTVPYLGGMGIFLSIILVVPFDLMVKTFLTILAVLGLYEDIKSKRIKFDYLIVLFSTLLVSYKYFPLYYIPVGLVISIVIIYLLQNIDHFDGLGVSLSLVSGFGLYFFVTSSFDKILILSLLGSLFAFSFYNFPPARIQLGRIGEYLIGGIIVAGIFSSSRGGFTRILQSFIVLTPILLEALPAILGKKQSTLSFKILGVVKAKRKMLYYMWAISGIYLIVGLWLYFGLVSSWISYLFYIAFTVFVLYYPGKFRL
ncbi:MAG: hypothetical protein H0Z24_07695 [Thermosipho sp. (in: Bacteria)]|nr:hypothetical protein [Thermosipho sp. (in: thermotogales)]